LKQESMTDRDSGGLVPRGRGRSPWLLWLLWAVWLPFLAPPIWNLLHAPPEQPRLIAALGGIAVFAAHYLILTWRNARRLVESPAPPGQVTTGDWLAIGGMAALSLALALLGNVNGSTLFEPLIFTSAYAGGRLPPARAVLVVAALDGLGVLAGLLSGAGGRAMVAALAFISVVGAAVILLVRAIATEWELRAAREEIGRLAVTAERLRIARDLHDLLGHNLSLITLKSELAGRLVAAAPERAAAEIGDVERVARGTLQQVREALAGYRQPVLADELHGAQEMLAAAGIDYRFEGDERLLVDLLPALEALLASTVREGVTNVIRHSHARHCVIRATRGPESVRVEITDDGAPGQSTQRQPGNGLRGLAERAAALGGTCEAKPLVAEHGGFRLVVSVPTPNMGDQP